MSEIKNTKRSFMNNVGIILFSQLAIKMLGFVYRLVITNIKGFGDAGNGFYSVGFQIYTLLLAVSSVGIPNAIAKLVSERYVKNDKIGAQNIFKTALVLFSLIGLGAAALLYFGSDFIAKSLVKLDGAQYTMKALAPSIFFVCVSSVIRGYFTGMQDMRATSSSQILEQVFKCALTIMFVWFAVGQTPEIMAAVANLATSVATVISAVYLFIFYKKNKLTFTSGEKQNIKVNLSGLAKTILMISIPISLGSIITAINRVIDTATITRGIEIAFANYIPAYGFKEAIVNPTLAQLNAEAGRLAGVLSKSDTLINMPLSLNIAFSTVLVPAIASALAIGDKKDAAQKINYSMLISIILILPCAVGYIALAQPIYKMIYPNASLGSDLLQLSAVALIFSALNQTMSGSLQGMGKIYTPATGLLFGCIAKIILNVILIRRPEINIYGAAISSIVCQIITFAICFGVLVKNIPVKLGLTKYILKPLLASVIMGVSAYGVYKLTISFLGNSISTIIAIGVAVVIYFVAVVLLRILNREEVEMLPFGNKLSRFIK